MNRQYVESTMIDSAGYDPINSILELEFKSDKSVWQYYDFPEHLWNEFLSSDSKGKFYHKMIKNKFRESRV